MPTISIITTTYNVGNTLDMCLDSVGSQRADVEHIVIDGGSTDASLEIAKEHKESIAKLVSEPDAGIYDAMNKGIRLATGEVIGILNADDYYSTDNILSSVQEVFTDKSIEACYGDLVYVGAGNLNKVKRYWQAGKFNHKKFYGGWMPPHPTFFVRASVYKKYGLFNLDLGSAADYEIMLRFLFKHQINVAYLPMVMVTMRTGGVSNSSLSNRLLANRMDREAWVVNGLQPKMWTLYAKPLRKVGQWFFPNRPGSQI